MEVKGIQHSKLKGNIRIPVLRKGNFIKYTPRLWRLQKTIPSKTYLKNMLSHIEWTKLPLKIKNLLYALCPIPRTCSPFSLVRSTISLSLSPSSFFFLTSLTHSCSHFHSGSFIISFSLLLRLHSLTLVILMLASISSSPSPTRYWILAFVFFFFSQN